MKKTSKYKFIGVSAMFIIGALLTAPFVQAAPVSSWSLNENIGYVAKDTVSGNNAMLTNGPTWVSGKLDSAIKFDGSNDYLKVLPTATVNNLKEMDLSMWIFPSNLGENNQGWLISKAGGGGGLPTNGWSLRLSNSPTNSLVFAVDYARSHLEVVTAKNSIILNQWNKVRVAWTGSNIASSVKIYVNDKEATYIEKINGAGSRSLDTVSPLLIGSNPSKNRSYKGVIDDVILNGSVVNISTTTTPPIATTTPPVIIVPPATTTTGIWKPKPFTTWQWQLTGTIDTTVNADMFDIDLYDVPQATISTLKNKGSKVICYFSAGSYEDWRPDAKSFPTAVLGNNNGWPGEKWLDIRNITALAPIMGARLDLAVQKGCDGVEPDNIDGYTNSTGFPLTAANQIAYNKWLAEAAHARGLSVGLKNDIDQVVQLEPYFDWALNEQCHQYKECDTLLPFIKKGKAVFITEYKLNTTDFCSSANAKGFMAMKKKLSLDAFREVCWSKVLTDNSLIEVNSNLNIRSAYGLNGQITSLAMKKLTGTILRGPVKIDGHNWYEIKFANGVTGWSSDVGFDVK